MEEKYFQRITTTTILILLIVLSFLLLRPILLSIIFGILLAFIFTPIYDWLYKKIKLKNTSATLICILLLAMIILPIWFLTPIVLDQSIKIYQAAQQIDFVTPLGNLFPDLFASDQFSSEIGSIIHSFVTKIASSLMNGLANFLLNLPNIFLQLVVVFFTFFFILRDKEKVLDYVKSLMPFSKDVEKKLFDSTKGITYSVLYGQVIVGIVQGIFVGIGFFLFGIPNALILTLLAVLAGILPIIGTALVWVPLAIYLLIGGSTFPAFGITLFGVFSSSVDNFLRPLIVSRRTDLHSSIVLIGMIGGLFFLGILGLILGPLILAYLLIVLEIYRKKSVPGLFIQEPEKNKKS